MFNAFKSIFGKGPSTSAAKNRLQMVLVQDRSGMSSSDMEGFKGEILGVISKYFLIEQKDLDVSWERNDLQTALVINTPITGRLSGAEASKTNGGNKSSNKRKRAAAAT